MGDSDGVVAAVTFAVIIGGSGTVAAVVVVGC